MGTLWHGSDGWIHVDRGGKIKASDEAILNEKIGRGDTPLYHSTDHWRDFIDCVRSRKETIAPVESGHRSISVGLLGEIAILTGEKLDWDPDQEVFLNSDVANKLLKRPYRSPWKFPA